jgi:hypothetical protein
VMNPTKEASNRDTVDSPPASHVLRQYERSRSVADPTMEEPNYWDTAGSVLVSPGRRQRELSWAEMDLTVEELNNWDIVRSLLACSAWCLRGVSAWH